MLSALLSPTEIACRRRQGAVPLGGRERFVVGALSVQRERQGLKGARQTCSVAETVEPLGRPPQPSHGFRVRPVVHEQIA